MDKAQQIYIASIAFSKGYDFEDLRYSDYMYGKEEYTDNVYDYVIECNEIGTIAFKEKYQDYKLYF